MYKCLKISYILPFFKRNCTFWSGKIRKTHSPVKTCWVDFWICRGTFGRWTWRAVCWAREAGPSWATGNTAEERKHRPVVRVRSRIISIRTDTVHNNRTSHSVATATTRMWHHQAYLRQLPVQSLELADLPGDAPAVVLAVVVFRQTHGYAVTRRLFSVLLWGLTDTHTGV